MNGQKPEPYTQWGLPPGAKARLGKGGIGRIRYSPDGTQLSTTGPIGIWLYDVHTCTEVAESRLLTVLIQLTMSSDGAILANACNDEFSCGMSTLAQRNLAGTYRLYSFMSQIARHLSSDDNTIGMGH